MGHRKIEIRKLEDGWRFEILPGNNHSQPMGISPIYLSLSECEKQKNIFCNLVTANCLYEEKTPFIVVIKDEATQYYRFCYKDATGVVILSSKRGYNQKANYKKAIKSIYNAVLENSLIMNDIKKEV